MLKPPAGSTKEIANQLAHLIVTGSNDREKILALEEKLGLTNAGANTGNSQSSSPLNLRIQGDREKEKKVGIWTSRLIDGKEYYVRDDRYKREFYSWARIQKIPPKNSKKRIVYLGESVARGFLLDPFYTPAGVLEALLNSEPNNLQTEVLDLARNDCNIDQLTELCSSCMALKPDVLVIFAGNNWLNSFDFSEDLVNKIIEVVDTKERFTGLKRLLENQYVEVITTFMQTLGNIARMHQVQVVFIIPGSNLGDFHSNSLQRINMWPEGETGKWLNLKKQIEEALIQEDFQQAETLIHELIKLNEGNSLGYEWLAKLKLKQELYTEAGEIFQMALDTAIFRPNNIPSCISVIQKTLREEACKYGIHVVDLPAIFKRCQQNKPAGRELFLDYCHLTVEGIQIAMAAAAETLFSLLTKKQVLMNELKTTAPKPDPDVMARAYFFAAVHNAHRSEQSYDVLYYLCRQALDASIIAKYLMLIYIQMATHHVAWFINKNCEKLIEKGYTEQFPYIVQPNNFYLMDINLVDAMVAALKEHDLDLEEAVMNLRKKEHGFTNGKINLLESYYYLESYIADYRPYNSHYRSLNPQSRFFLVAGNDSDVFLKLTYRVPWLQKKENVYFQVNGSITAESPASPKWKDFSLQIPKELLKDGVNHITIHWPPHLVYKKIKKNEALKPNLKLLKQLMFPPYGEIHMLKVFRK